jgi:hypothetical protein
MAQDGDVFGIGVRGVDRLGGEHHVVAVQVDPGEKAKFETSLSPHRLQGLKPGGFKLWFQMDWTCVGAPPRRRSAAR